jgi:hypothetical protein
MSETPPERHPPVVDGQDHVADPPLSGVASEFPIPLSKPIEKPKSRDLVCGVNPVLVERFLSLIVNNYKRADKATFFLEQRTGVVNFQGITNVRDVLSHLVTFLNPNTSDEKRLEQLSNAEEHLRRAINEPYEIGLNRLVARFDKLYDEYKRRVLPITHKHTTLANAPNTTSIEATVREIRDLTAIGRSSKGANAWNADWEAGVTSFIEGFDKLSTLYTDLEGYVFRVDQIEKEKRSTLLHLGGYALAIILFLIVLLFPSLPDRLRTLLHLQKPPEATQPQK